MRNHSWKDRTLRHPSSRPHVCWCETTKQHFNETSNSNYCINWMPRMTFTHFAYLCMLMDAAFQSELWSKHNELIKSAACFAPMNVWLINCRCYRFVWFIALTLIPFHLGAVEHFPLNDSYQSGLVENFGNYRMETTMNEWLPCTDTNCIHSMQMIDRLHRCLISTN